VGQTPVARFGGSQASREVSTELPRPPFLDRRVTHPRTLEAIFWGGLVAGIFDAIDAMVWVTANGISIPRLFKFIASGLIGVTAFKAGPAVVALGVGLHFLIATGAATAYALLSLKLPVLLQKPFFCGPVFGLGAYIFMHYVVLPLSAVPPQGTPTFIWVANQLFSHTIFVGLPIALIARRAARGQSDAATTM
jgi:uncharacterized membrane protein YagU involved in acid resistance